MERRYELDGADVLADSWFEHMRRGELEAAWRLSDQALLTPRDSSLPRHFQRVWNGEPVQGKRVLVRCHHGLGDTIQFIRYAEPLSGVASEVNVWAQPELIPLLRHGRGIDRLLPLHEGEPRVERDVDVEVMELPHLFRSTLDDLPAAVPYLHVDPAPRPASSRLSVGLVWRAGEWDGQRSIPLRLLRPLERIPGVELHLLQRGRGLEERPAGFGILAGSDDALEAARRIASLDLVVSVDSMPAHLAGALGVPVWLLLRADADWRWLSGREDSPWYPSMRLFRQPVEGDWDSVGDRVARELAAAGG